MDGTLCKTCHPSFFQSSCTAITNNTTESSFVLLLYQMALLESMYALESGNEHNIFLLSKSGIWNKLWVCIPYEAPEDYKTVIHWMNSDPVIPQSISDVLGYENPADGTVHSLRILQLQKFVSDVEWVFAKILAQWIIWIFRTAMDSSSHLTNIKLLVHYQSIVNQINFVR